MPQTPIQELRTYLGDDIPPGGSDADTMFTDEQVQSFLDRGQGNFMAVLYWAWLAKMGKYADLVNTVEGNAAREMGENLKNAERMVMKYQRMVPHLAGRVRQGRIARR